MDWWRQWYPMAFTDDLDPKLPTRLELLGKQYVLWADASKTWHCFEDKCPHRLAPLSEGRIDEQGNLQCAYHGWSFSGEGRCTSIPQAEVDIKEVAERAGRACATVLPTRVAQGMVWVWPDSSKEGVEASRVKAPSTIAELDDPAFVKGAWAMRDLEYGYDTLIENVVDPAHVPFSHHGVQARREQAMPLNVSVRYTGPEGVFLNLPRLANSTIDFVAPVRLQYKFDFSGFFKKMPLAKAIFALEKRIRGMPADMKPTSMLVTYAIPRGPGKSRVLALFPRNFLTLQKPRWLDHLERNAVLDGDLVFLHGQEREMRKPQYGWQDNIDRTFYMPTRSDEGVRAFRQWIVKFGSGGPKWADGVSGELGPFNPSREFLMDRYHQHTVQCSACRGALRNIKILKTLMTAVSVLGATAVWSRPACLLKVLAASAIAGAAAVGLGKLEKRFYFTDYIHAVK